MNKKKYKLSDEDIIFKNSDNGYTVLNIDYNGSLLTCVGKCLSVNVGEDVELEGQFVKNNKDFAEMLHLYNDFY